jgi:hypothetical protein
MNHCPSQIFIPLGAIAFQAFPDWCLAILFFIQIYRNWLIRKFDIVAYLTAENLALRQQIIVLKRNQNRPHIKERDRMFWKVLSNIWPSWRDSLVIVQPETVIRWHRKAFRFYWRRKCRGVSRGRPNLSSEATSLVLILSAANPLWGATSAAPPRRPHLGGPIPRKSFNDLLGSP